MIEHVRIATVASHVTTSRHCACAAVVAVLLGTALSTMGCDSHGEKYKCDSHSKDCDVRVAFLGTSFTYYNNMPDMFAEISAHADPPIHVGHAQVAFGGSSIFKQADQSSDFGRQTKKMLEHPDGWDYVVFQDQSQVPGGGKDQDDHLEPDVGRNMSLEALLTFYPPLLRQAKATPVLFATWGKPHGDPYNAECCGYDDFLSMNNLTTKGYQMYADALKAVVDSSKVRTAPCGQAYKLAYLAEDDPLNSTSRFSRLLTAFGGEGHPSLLGSYLVANVFFGVIHRRSPKEVTWAPDGFSPADVEAVKQLAHNAVFGENNLDHVMEEGRVVSVA